MPERQMIRYESPIVRVDIPITQGFTEAVIESSQEALGEFIAWLNGERGDHIHIIGRLAGNLTQAVEIMKDSLDKRK